MGLTRKTKERLRKAIAAFKLKDFVEYVLQVFNQVTIEEIVQIVKENRLQPNKKQISSIFLNLFLTQDIDNAECERGIVLLQAQAVALRPESRLWKALELSGEPDTYGLTESRVEDMVTRSLRRNGISTITRAVHHSSAFWINITIKRVTKNHGIELSSPIYCVFYTDHPFIFINNTNVDSIKKGVFEAFGFVGIRRCKLTGRDPKSMLEILATRDARVVRSADIDSEPLETTNGINFSHYHKRQKYMDEIFPPDTPKLADYSVECRAAPWHLETAFPELADSEHPIKVHLRTKDTIAMFRALGEEGILEVPVPPFINRALRCARNKVTVRANRDLTFMDQTNH